MKQNLLKTLLVFAVIAIFLGAMSTWYESVVLGKYWVSAGIGLTLLTCILLPLAIFVLAIYAVIAIIRYKGGSKVAKAMVLICALSAATFNACARGNANVQTLITDDCGVTWRLIPPGQVIPARIGVCSYKITVPNYPMQGETSFKTSFKDRVLAKVEVGYEYIIFDGIKFVSEAKYLGKANTSVDDATNQSVMYESAENAVIDKRIREAATSMLLQEDIVEFSQAEFEDRLLERVNKMLEEKGVRLNFLSFVPTPEEQTRLAIDMMTAMRVYESKGLIDLGKAVSTARAGATKVTVITGDSNKPDEDQK